MNKTQIAEAVAGAKCFCGYTRSQHYGVQAYLLAKIAGISTDPGYLVSQSSCYSCIHPSVQNGIFAYLIQQMTGATGSPQQIVYSVPCVTCVPKGEFDSLKTYLLYIVAREETGETLTPSQLIDVAAPLVALPEQYQISVLNYVANEVGGEPPFDPTLCAITVLNGGGDKFDCYTVGGPYTTLPAAGTNLTGTWILANGFFAYVYGDDYESYTVGTVGTLNGGTGSSVAWTVADSPKGYFYGDSFDTYTVGVAPTMSQGTGLSGSWTTGNSVLGNPVGDSFDTYTVGAAGTLGSGTGFTGDWIYA